MYHTLVLDHLADYPSEQFVPEPSSERHGVVLVEILSKLSSTLYVSLVLVHIKQLHTRSMPFVTWLLRQK